VVQTAAGHCHPGHGITANLLAIGPLTGR
jgi:hypothetical protein